MLSRVRGAHQDGFTLVELLVVMLVVGVLAAVAVPLFLSQRAKAHDASTKADVSNLGKEIAAYFVEGAGTLSLDFASVPGSVVVRDGAGYSSTVNLTNGTARPTFGASSAMDDRDRWCVALTDNRGALKVFRFSAWSGLEEGTC